MSLLTPSIIDVFPELMILKLILLEGKAKWLPFEETTKDVLHFWGEWDFNGQKFISISMLVWITAYLGVPQIFFRPKYFFVCDLKPHAKFQNLTITPSGRKVSQWEGEKRPLIVNTVGPIGISHQTGRSECKNGDRLDGTFSLNLTMFGGWRVHQNHMKLVFFSYLIYKTKCDIVFCLIFIQKEIEVVFHLHKKFEVIFHFKITCCDTFPGFPF